MSLTALLNESILTYEISDKTQHIKNLMLIAEEYFKQQHYASAISYYLTALNDTDTDNDLKYEILIQIAISVWKTSGRNSAVHSALYNAIALIPTRPEAYHVMSLLHESQGQWIECYTYSKLSETYRNNAKSSQIDYNSVYSSLFQIAVSSWWIGRYKESEDAFIKLSNDYASFLPDPIKQLVITNMRTAGFWHAETKYNSQMWNKLKNKFQGSAEIERNYSQTFQDLFVLTMLQGKRNGYFLELGAADPFWQSNTALLEQFDWNGISIDIKPFDYSKRKAEFIVGDGLELDYMKLLKNAPSNIDYLQLDCEPPDITYSILTRIPFDTYKFAVITFEHDAYIHGDEWVIKSRDYLTAKGYKLIVSNVAPDRLCAFEDWWIHPDLVEESIYSQYMDTTDSVKKSSDILLDV